jgi:hypothetical protein
VLLSFASTRARRLVLIASAIAHIAATTIESSHTFVKALFVFTWAPMSFFRRIAPGPSSKFDQQDSEASSMLKMNVPLRCRLDSTRHQ